LQKSLQQRQEDDLALTADAIVGSQVLQSGLGEDAIAGSAHDDLGLAGGPADVHHIPYGLR
jgi:hypothetical protein